MSGTPPQASQSPRGAVGATGRQASRDRDRDSTVTRCPSAASPTVQAASIPVPPMTSLFKGTQLLRTRLRPREYNRCHHVSVRQWSEDGPVVGRKSEGCGLPRVAATPQGAV